MLTTELVASSFCFSLIVSIKLILLSKKLTLMKINFVIFNDNLTGNDVEHGNF